MGAVKTRRAGWRARQECPMSEDVNRTPERKEPNSGHGMPCPYADKNPRQAPIAQWRSSAEMKKQTPHAAEAAGFGMPISDFRSPVDSIGVPKPDLRRIGISNRNTPELKPGLSRFGSMDGCLLIATLSTTRRRIVVPSDQRESRDLHFASRRSVTAKSSTAQPQAHPSHNPRRMRHPERQKPNPSELAARHLPLACPERSRRATAVLIYGTGIRIHRNPMKTNHKTFSNTRYRTPLRTMFDCNDDRKELPNSNLFHFDQNGIMT